MSFYLAWSLTQVVATMLIAAAISATLATYTKFRYGTYLFLASVVVVMTLAINVGHRQAELGRSSFDADLPSASQERVESQRLTRDDATSKLHETIKTQRNSN